MVALPSKSPSDLVVSATSSVSRSWYTWHGLQPPTPGELCYAIVLCRPQRTWRPRPAASIPGNWRRGSLFSHGRCLGVIVREVLGYNAKALANHETDQTWRLQCWAIAVKIVRGFANTARAVDLKARAKGGAA